MTINAYLSTVRSVCRLICTSLASRSRPKTHFYALLSLCLIFLAARDGFSQTVKELAKNVGRSVVLIRTYDATGTQIAQGSGVFLTDEGLILTNAHVIRNAFSARVEYEGGVSHIVTVWSEDAHRDLAVLAIDASGIPSVSLTDVSPEVGDHVVAIGNPFGLGGSVSDGLVSGIRTVDESLELLQITAPISPGSSGGVLLNDSGQMVGITTSSLSEGQNVNFAVSSNSILQFLIESSADTSATYPRQLEAAEKSVWWRAALKWVLTAIVWIIALVFGDSFWFAVPILIGVCYLVFLVLSWIFRGLSYPIRVYLRAREDEKAARAAPDSTSVMVEDSEARHIDAEYVYTNAEVSGNNTDFTFHCWKCGEEIVIESESSGAAKCPYCLAENRIPDH